MLLLLESRILWTKSKGTAAIKPSIVVTNAWDIPPAMSLGSPVPNNVIAWKVSIIPITVPRRPNNGATAARSLITLKFFSSGGVALANMSSSWDSKSSGLFPEYFE